MISASTSVGFFITAVREASLNEWLHAQPTGTQNLALTSNIRSHSDLRTWDPDSQTWSWADNNPVLGTSIRSIPAQWEATPQGPPLLRVGQHWSSARLGAMVWEIRGIDKPCIEVNTYAPFSATSLNILQNLQPGTPLSLTHDELVQGLTPGTCRITTSRISPSQPLCIRDIQPSPSPLIDPIEPQVLNFFSNFHDQFEGFPLSEALLFTDGSFSKSRDPTLSVFDHFQHPRAAGSVILLARNGSHPPIAFYLTDGIDVNIDSAPSMELVTLYAAISLRTHLHASIPIYTDSQTSLDQILAPISANDPRSAGYHIVVACCNLLRYQPGPLLKVAAHPERRLPCPRWDIFMWGNHMADVIASHGPLAQLKGIPPGMRSRHFPATSIPTMEVVAAAATNCNFYWSAGGQHTMMTVCNPYPHVARTALHQYLETREEYSAEIGRNSDWVDTSAAFAARCWKLRQRSLRSRAFALRIIWDKGLHGGNRSKGSNHSPPLFTFLSRCTVCAGVDSADH